MVWVFVAAVGVFATLDALDALATFERSRKATALRGAMILVTQTAGHSRRLLSRQFQFFVPDTDTTHCADS